MLLAVMIARCLSIDLYDLIRWRRGKQSINMRRHSFEQERKLLLADMVLTNCLITEQWRSEELHPLCGDGLFLPLPES